MEAGTKCWEGSPADSGLCVLHQRPGTPALGCMHFWSRMGMSVGSYGQVPTEPTGLLQGPGGGSLLLVSSFEGEYFLNPPIPCFHVQTVLCAGLMAPSSTFSSVIQDQRGGMGHLGQPVSRRHVTTIHLGCHGGHRSPCPLHADPEKHFSLKK